MLGWQNAARTGARALQSIKFFKYGEAVHKVILPVNCQWLHTA